MSHPVETKNGLLVTRVSLGDLAARLLSIAKESDARSVALSLSKSYQEEDQSLYKEMVRLSALYQEQFPSVPQLSKDLGYVVSTLRSDYREEADPVQVFINQVEASVDKLAVVLFLNDDEGYISFPNVQTSVRITEGCTVMFPSNWFYKPELHQKSPELFVVTTFLK